MKLVGWVNGLLIIGIIWNLRSTFELEYTDGLYWFVILAAIVMNIMGIIIGFGVGEQK